MTVVPPAAETMGLDGSLATAALGSTKCYVILNNARGGRRPPQRQGV